MFKKIKIKISKNKNKNKNFEKSEKQKNKATKSPYLLIFDISYILIHVKFLIFFWTFTIR